MKYRVDSGWPSIFLLNIEPELVDEHEKWCEVEEETDMEHSPELVNNTTELEDASTLAWVWYQD